MIPFIIKTNSLSLFPDNQAPVTINSDHINFAAVKQALIDGDFTAAVTMASAATWLATVTAGNISIVNDEVLYKGEILNNYLTRKMLTFLSEGLPVEHYCRFLDNLMSNPSMVSRNELYLFLEAADLPITEDGCFLAYKAVRHDYRDKHSGQFDNSPGITHSMPRRDVDDNRERTCSYGFHAAAFDYARGFMNTYSHDRLVAVKINPADVVSVPSDYNNQKLRTCKYVVEFEIKDASDTLTGTSYFSPASEAVFDPEENSYFWGDIWNDDGDEDDAI